MTVIKKSTDTGTGISVVRNGALVETYNILGTKIHVVDSSRAQEGILIHRWFSEVFDDEIKEVLGGHFVDEFGVHRCPRLLADLSQWGRSAGTGSTTGSATTSCHASTSSGFDTSPSSSPPPRMRASRVPLGDAPLVLLELYDVTAHKRSEKALLDSKKQLEKAELVHRELDRMRSVRTFADLQAAPKAAVEAGRRS